MSEAAECAVACCGLFCMELCRRRHESGERFLGNKQRRIEILFQSTEFHLLSKCGFTVGQASRSSRNEDCCEECCRVCCEDCCCENNEVAATTQVVYVARGNSRVIRCSSRLVFGKSWGDRRIQYGSTHRTTNIVNDAFACRVDIYIFLEGKVFQRI